MNPNAPISHRTIPTSDDVLHHQWREVIERTDPNSITNSALVFSDFLESTSNWNQHHIIAFRMLDFNDLPIQSIYPEEFYPSLDDPVILEARGLFTLSNDAVRKGKLDIRQTGAAFLFYRTLQDCLRTQHKTPSPPQAATRPERSPQPTNPSHSYTVSDSSGSSFLPSTSSISATMNPTSEDKTETVTNVLLINYLYLLAELENAGKEAAGNRNVLISADHDRFSVMLEGKACGSENDGSAWRSRWSSSSRQWVKSGPAPLLSLECKRLDHGKSRFQILVQEGGELLAIQQLKGAHNRIQSKRDEEAFLICCHHTSLFITSCVIDTKFLESVRHGKLNTNQFMCIKHSIQFDLADGQGVIEGARAVLGLLRYLLAE